jgi:hypothetical protein
VGSGVLVDGYSALTFGWQLGTNVALVSSKRATGFGVVRSPVGCGGRVKVLYIQLGLRRCTSQCDIFSNVSKSV